MRRGVLCAIALSMLAAVCEAKCDIYGLVGRVGSSAIVMIDGGERSALADATGNFILGGVDPGTHILEIVSDDMVFPSIRLEVNERGANRYRAIVNDGSGRVLLNAFTDISAAQAAAAADRDYPTLVIEPLGRHGYFVPRQAFSILSIIANPSILIMVVAMGMMYVMPMIADQDEMRAQMKEMQRGQSAPKPAAIKKSQ